MNLKALVAMVLLAGCTPTDQLVGSFAFTLSGTETTTAPGNSSSTSTGTGTLAVTHGVATDYVVVIAQTDSNPCTLLGSATKDKPTVITISAGQKCQFLYSTGSVTATLGSGSVTLDSMTQNTATLSIDYSYAGTVFGINYAGTGARTYTGPRF